MSRTDKRNFCGKVVLITGSSSGMGAGAALEFAKRGALLSLTGRSASKLQEVAKECKSISPANHQPLITVGDVSDETDIEKVFRATIQTYGRLNVLVNNVGIAGPFAEIEDISLPDFDYVFKVNVRAPFYMTQLAIPELEKTKGCIVNISASASNIAWTVGTPYAMTKSALDHFTRCAANALGPKGIRVNAINPGAVPTTTFIRGKIEDDHADQVLKHVENSSPLRKLGTTEDIAYAIAFLASDEASFITGATLFADGGLAITNKMDR